MFNPQSDYALNKLDREAIVCPSTTGVHIRLTREDFASEEEFLFWKKLSDGDYKGIESAGRNYYDNCISLSDTQHDGVSVEDAFLAPLLSAEQKERQAALMQLVRTILTETQYRRLKLHLVDGLSIEQIAQQECVTHQSISECLAAAKERVVNNL